jgi:uncharacterized protein
MMRRGRRSDPGRHHQVLRARDRELFVDTGAWFAVQTPDDRWHEAAASTLRWVVSNEVVLVTTNHVVGETYTLLRVRQGLAAARRFITALRESPRVIRLHVGEDLERQAWTLLEQFEDQAFSFVDGTSFVTMKHRDLSQAFAFDQHFRTAGFRRVPVDNQIF